MKVKSKIDKILSPINGSGVVKSTYKKNKIYYAEFNEDRSMLFVKGIGFYDWIDLFEIMEE